MALKSKRGAFQLPVRLLLASVRMLFVRLRLRMLLRTLLRLSMLLGPCLRTLLRLRLWTRLFLVLDWRRARFGPFLRLRPCLRTLGR